MNPRRTLQENESALRKVLTQRTLEALSKQNVAFVLEHQNDTLEQLSAYLSACMDTLGHVPAWTEVLGGDLIERASAAGCRRFAASAKRNSTTRRTRRGCRTHSCSATSLTASGLWTSRKSLKRRPKAANAYGRRRPRARRQRKHDPINRSKIDQNTQLLWQMRDPGQDTPDTHSRSAEPRESGENPGHRLGGDAPVCSCDSGAFLRARKCTSRKWVIVAGKTAVRRPRECVGGDSSERFSQKTYRARSSGEVSSGAGFGARAAEAPLFFCVMARTAAITRFPPDSGVCILLYIAKKGHDDEETNYSASAGSGHGRGYAPHGRTGRRCADSG